MPASSKPNVPISAFGAGGGAGSATGGATSAGGGGTSTGCNAHDDSAVPAASKAIQRFILRVPSNTRADFARFKSLIALSPLARNPPAPSDQRHPISCKRRDCGDDRQPGQDRRRGVGEQPGQPATDAGMGRD